MNQASKLSIAMEIIENRIGECMIQLRTTPDEKLQKKYQNLIKIRDEIYKGNNEVIEKVIKREQG